MSQDRHADHLAPESQGDVLLVDDGEGVRTLTLNRPAAFNSLTVALKEELLAALAQGSAEWAAVQAEIEHFRQEYQRLARKERGQADSSGSRAG